MNEVIKDVVCYSGTFVKKSGEERSMSYVKVKDAPERLIPSHVDKKERALQEGSELVWDLDSKGYRVFNHKTVVGALVEGRVNLSFKVDGYDYSIER